MLYGTVSLHAESRAHARILPSESDSHRQSSGLAQYISLENRMCSLIISVIGLCVGLTVPFILLHSIFSEVPFDSLKYVQSENT
jgi:hypothetical protein